MGRVALRGLSARKLRVALTLLAVALGVTLIAGTYVLTDTINQSFDNIFQAGAKGTDVSVTPREPLGSGDQIAQQTVPESVLRTVEKLPGVSESEGSIFTQVTILDAKGKKLGGGMAPSFVASVQLPRFEGFKLKSGRKPAAPGEAQLDVSTAKRKGVKIGDRIQVVGQAPKRAYTVVGLVAFAGVESFGGTSVAVVSLPEAQKITGDTGQFDSIELAATAGTSPEQLRAQVAKALPPKFVARTGQQQAAKQSKDIRDNLGFLRTALLVFAAISLFVGGFLIFNTFSITVAQRTREFGLLRTLGATRSQVLRSVLTEGFVLGLVGSLIGLGLGIALAPGLRALFKAIGADLPSNGTVIQTRTIVVSILIGTLVALVSGLFPALRATRVEPIAALREGLPPSGRGARLTQPFGALLTIAGAVLLGIGLIGGGGIALVGAGAAAIFLGVALLSPKLVAPLAAVVGAPMQRFGGVPGRLARENAVRQPGRTAATAAALMIGVALVSFVTIFATGAKHSLDTAVDSALHANVLIVQNTDGFGPFPNDAAKAVAGVSGVRAVSPIAFSQAKLGSKKLGVSAVDTSTFAQVYTAKFKEGSNATIAALGPGDTVLSKKQADKLKLKVGSTISVLTPASKKVSLTVRGISDDRGGVLDDLTVPLADARTQFGERQDSLAFVDLAPGADANAVKKDVDRVLKSGFPVAEAKTAKQFKDAQAGQVNQLLTLIYVLLSLAVIVSLFGIVNTLALSIHERTRELGMLRAIGTSRSQVRRMIRYEAVITSLIGAVLGVILGVLFAIAIGRSLSDSGFKLSFPVPTLLIMLVLAAIAGILAAIAPARRASRMNVLEALAYE